MIEPLSWEWRNEAEENPFRKGSTRPLRITIHNASFANLTPEHERALSLLRELGTLEDFDVLETDRGAERNVQIAPPSTGRDYFDVTVTISGERARGTYVPYPKQQLTTAQVLTAQGAQHPDVASALQDVVLVGAHRALDRDLLVTESPWIHHHRWRQVSRTSNPRRLADALKIVGLLLHSREKYVFRTEKASTFGLNKFSRSLYYWILMRHRLPSLWRYCHACYEFRERRTNDVSPLTASILLRCQHALEARDYIGEVFYSPYSDASRDHTAYHFDYLTLLLVGALDAQARIAHRVYRISGSDRVNFRGGTNSGFLRRLKEAGANPLWELLTIKRTTALLTLLHEIRNTIHSASLISDGYMTTGKGPGWIEVQEGELCSEMWSAASDLDGPEAWGLKKNRYRLGSDGPLLEPLNLVPYPFSVRLVTECLSLVNRIAEATEVERLYEGRAVPPLDDKPPTDDMCFAEDVMTRLDLLS